MRWSLNLERSYAVAAWLFVVAAMVVAMVLVGGLTRLTGSGLSITEWRPVTGAVPPLDGAAWQAEFARYQHIPQYQLVNRGMTLDQFKWIYGWEWTHRLLGRLIGLVFVAPLAVFLWRRMIPRRLWWRCGVILALGALQGLVGWWMVASGLADRVSVAPERLATHLGLALVLYAACVWTGLEAWSGRGRPTYETPAPWRTLAFALLGAVFIQIVLGALVAGNGAGRINTDWPLMTGRLFPRDYVAPGLGLLGSWIHGAAAVQLNHRLFAYALWAAALAFAVLSGRDRHVARPVRNAAWLLFAALTLQALLGIWTLRSAAPLGLSALHQLGAVGVLTAALYLPWRMLRD